MGDAPDRGHPDPGFCVITGKTVAAVLAGQAAACVDAVRDAYFAHADGYSVNPSSVFLRFPDNPKARIIALPAYLGAPWAVSGIKWIASYPDNIHQGLPRASAVLILNDPDTGRPIACLESSIISAVRTAASAVLAAAALSARGRRARTLGIIGTGFIAGYVYRFLVETGWDIGDVRLFDLDTAQAGRFAAQIRDNGRHGSVGIADSAAAVIAAADLIVFTTVSAQPYIHDAAPFAHNPLVLHLSLRDLAPELMLGATNIVDDVAHVLTANTSLHLAEQQAGHRGFVTGTLSQVLRGECTLDRARPVIFSPFGLGILDLAIGKVAYDRAVERGEHLPIADFFCDPAR